MHARRNTLLALITLLAFVFAGIASAETPTKLSTASTVDFDGFLALSQEVAAYRADRLVDLEDFNSLARQPGVIILDTRSAFAYEMGHIDGAVHLNFSDFTTAKLAETIPDTSTTILIYCNNNFIEDIEPVMVKSAPLALNVPTFINLYGYGYTEIYELGELVSLVDERVNWVSPATLQ